MLDESLGTCPAESAILVASVSVVILFSCNFLIVVTLFS